MGKTKEFEAKSTQEALDKAVADTGIPLSELKFEIISQGGAGIFGLSLKKAKIKVILPDKDGGKAGTDGKRDRKPRQKPRRSAKPAETEGRKAGRDKASGRSERSEKSETDKQSRQGGEKKRKRPPRKPKPRQPKAPLRDKDTKPVKEQPIKERGVKERGVKEKPVSPPPPPPEPKAPARPEPPRNTWASPGAVQPSPPPAPEPEPEKPEEAEPAQAPVEAVLETVVEEPVQEEVQTPDPTGWAAPSRVKPLPAKEHKEINLESIVHQPKLRPTGRVDVDLTSAEFNGNRSSRRGGGGRGRGGRPPRRDDRGRREGGSRDSRGRDGDRGRGGEGAGYRREDRDDSYRDHMPRQPKSGPAEPYSPKVTDPNASTDYERTGMDQENLEWAKDQLVGLLDLVVGETKVDASWVEEKMYLNIIGDGSGLLIGRKGQTLDALQFVMGKMVDKHTGRHYRLMVDTEGYRGRREDSLIEQANILADKVEKGGRPARTGPLNPHERRIIHLALMENGKVRTGSQGEGTYKRVVVSLKRRD